jgi:rfaE bifunctional protein kinase chain/domain
VVCPAARQPIFQTASRLLAPNPRCVTLFAVKDILDKAPSLAALIVGDVCLDRWCRYDPQLAEPSRETGIPRTAVTSTEVTPGAAGTVANNMAALGVGRVSVLGVIGRDGHGYELCNALGQRGIENDLLVESAEVQTFTYTKLINQQTGREDQPRIDFVNHAALPQPAVRMLLDRLQSVFDLFDIVMVCDQAESGCGGVINVAVRTLIQELAPVYPDKVILVDSRTHIADFRGVIAKPNHIEAGSASRELFGRVDYPALCEHMRSPLLIVTHGGEGVLLVNHKGEQWVRTRPVENPVDICGAGDSFAAGFTVAYAATRDAARAAEFGNQVASITIMKPGTGTASPEELLAVQA